MDSFCREGLRANRAEGIESEGEDMKRTALATLGITLGLATLAPPALAQVTTQAPADFGPPRPAATMEDPGLATAATPDAEAVTAPAPATAASEPAPVVIEQAPAVVEEPPPARVEEAYASTTTRRAAPDRRAPLDRRDANPQTGHYLGHGLFNNWGPNDFGA